MNTEVLSQAIKQNDRLFWFNLISSFIFQLLSILVFLVSLAFSILLSPIFLVGLGVAHRLYKASLSYSQEAGKCARLAFEMALRSAELAGNEMAEHACKQTLKSEFQNQNQTAA